MAARLIKLLLAAALLCMGFQVFAVESLPDPTKPAVDIPYETDEGKGNGTADVIQAPKKVGLQSIRISPNNRVAVINGETVVLGGKIGDATLVEIRENSVLLEGSQGKRVMELFPGVHLNKAAVAAHDKENIPRIQNNSEIKQGAGRKHKKISGSVDLEQDKDKRESK